jgi:hypothetical protein
MTDVTCILSAIERGDAHAAEQLLPLVYDELRKLAAQRLAREKPGQMAGACAWFERQLLDSGPSLEPAVESSSIRIPQAGDVTVWRAPNGAAGSMTRAMM